jgi:hypothetical protein
MTFHEILKLSYNLRLEYTELFAQAMQLFVVIATQKDFFI